MLNPCNMFNTDWFNSINNWFFTLFTNCLHFKTATWEFNLKQFVHFSEEIWIVGYNLNIKRHNISCCHCMNLAYWKYMHLPTFLQNWKKLPIIRIAAVFSWNEQCNSTKFYSFSHKVWFTRPEFRLRKPNFLNIPCTILYYDLKTILTCCKIWKLLLLNVSITASFVSDLLDSSHI